MIGFIPGVLDGLELIWWAEFMPNSLLVFKFLHFTFTMKIVRLPSASSLKFEFLAHVDSSDYACLNSLVYCRHFDYYPFILKG